MQQLTAKPSSLKARDISSAEMKNFFMQAPAAMAVFHGPEFRYTLVNPVYEQLFNRSAKELIGITLKEAWPEIKESSLDIFNKVYKTGQPYSANEYPSSIHSNGSDQPRYFNFIVYPVKNEKGDVTDLVVQSFEATRYMQARKKDNESEQKFRSLVQEFPLFVWQTDHKLQTTFLNKTGIDYFDIDESKISELSWKRFIHPADLDRVLSIMNTSIEQHEPYTLKMRLKNAISGEYRWFLDNGMPQFSNNQFSGFIGTSMDIHEQHLAEEAIIQSEEKYKHLSGTLEEQVNQRTAELVDAQNLLQQVIDASVEFIIVLDKDLRIITINTKFEETRSLDRNDVKGKTLFEISPDAEGTIQHESILKALQGETVHLGKRTSIAKPDLFVDTYFIPLRLKENVEGVIIMSRDVTEIVKSELILESKNRELNDVHHIAQIGSWEWTVSSNKVKWSDEMFHIYGYGEERFDLSFEKAIERMLPEDADRARERMTQNIGEAEELFKEKKIPVFINPLIEYPIFLPDGTKKILRGAGKIILREDGKVSKVIGTVQDITEQKKSEEQIKTINKQLNEAQEIAQLGSWEWNVATNELSWSENLYNIYEADPADAINYEKFVSFIHPDDRKYVEELIGFFYKNKRFHEFYHRIITPDGTVKTLHSRGEIIVNDEGDVVKMIGTGQDVTKEKIIADKLVETNEQLEQRNEFTEKLIDSSLDLITVIDKDLRFITINKKAESVIQKYYPGDLIGKKITDVNPEISSTEFYQDLLKAFNGEIIIRDNAKSTVSNSYYEHNHIPLMDASDEVYAVMTISHDITENIKQMEELRKLNESDKLKSDFIKMASHELKTPVTSIKGYVQLLLDALNKKEDEEKSISPALMNLSLISIDKQITRLTRLMSELLDLSKIETGKLELNSELFNLNELVIETVQDILYTHPKHKITITHDFGCSVFGDRDRIGQVLINFLTNAIKYSPDSDRIEVDIRKSGEKIVSVSVKDYGIGIDKKYHDKIFGRFYRVEGKEEQTYPGFGIGLFIAKEIIKQHEGSIHFISEKGNGSVFTFTLSVAE